MIISILYPGGECDAACQRKKKKGLIRARTFCRKPALQQSWHEALAKCGQRHADRNYVSVSQGKQASAHSLKSSRLDLKMCIDQLGTNGNHFPLWIEAICYSLGLILCHGAWSWNKKLHYLNRNWFKKKIKWSRLAATNGLIKVWPRIHEGMRLCVKKWVNVDIVTHFKGFIINPGRAVLSQLFIPLFRNILTVSENCIVLESSITANGTNCSSRSINQLNWPVGHWVNIL